MAWISLGRHLDLTKSPLTGDYHTMIRHHIEDSVRRAMADTPVVGKNAIWKVEVPEISGTNQLAEEEDRGWKPMIRSRDEIKCPRITGCSNGRCSVEMARRRFFRRGARNAKLRLLGVRNGGANRRPPRRRRFCPRPTAEAVVARGHPCPGPSACALRGNRRYSPAVGDTTDLGSARPHGPDTHGGAIR